jgi:hypothetical protein
MHCTHPRRGLHSRPELSFQEVDIGVRCGHALVPLNCSAHELWAACSGCHHCTQPILRFSTHLTVIWQHTIPSLRSPATRVLAIGMDASCTLACPRVGALTLGRGCDRRPCGLHAVALHTPLSLSFATHLTASRCYMATYHHWGRQLPMFAPLAGFSLACPTRKCSI